MSLPDDIALTGYTSQDADAVRYLHRLAFRHLAAAHHTAAQIAGHEALIAAADYAEDLARSHLILARHATAGLVATAGWLGMDDRPHTARIRKVFVHPDWARRGLASALVRQAEQDAAALGFSRLFLRANVNAVPLYERLGYRVVEAGTMAAGGAALPVYFMAKPNDV